ncbi:hypothetical protein [Snodgrassella alvi]|uniref:hypothetical protein n=1 Tax=Snodgrassella alvi TaxID=1196083 RepID=UPI00099881A6|nr:hypothetical protein [Snodgrassella alvi]OOX79310.1 hypothetical protein BGH94_04510 [Snodgrassella alvi]ORF01843.1 hypothetical protein BGH95_06140 [Snodgrassella alvi]
MKHYINNFNASLLEVLGEDKQLTRLVLDESATKKITAILPRCYNQSSPEHYMRLTLQSMDGTSYELIDICNNGGELSIWRAGMEGTACSAWPAGTQVLCAATAASFSNDGGTAVIKYEDAINDQLNALKIDALNGLNQVLLPVTDESDESDESKNLPIVIVNMKDGDEMLLEFKGIDTIDELPAFLNASRLAREI